MWAGLPWPRLDLEDGEDSGVSIVAEEADERLARCVKALRDSDLVHPGGVCTTLEVCKQFVVSYPRIRRDARRCDLFLISPSCFGLVWCGVMSSSLGLGLGLGLGLLWFALV